jgi:hypothetical protein
LACEPSFSRALITPCLCRRGGEKDDRETTTARRGN